MKTPSTIDVYAWFTMDVGLSCPWPLSFCFLQAEANLCAYEALRTRCLSILLSAALQHMRHTEDLLLSRLREKQQQSEQEQLDASGLDLSILHVQFEVLMAPTRPVMQILREKQSLGLSDAYGRFVTLLFS